jgi:hypothetical protein
MLPMTMFATQNSPTSAQTTTYQNLGEIDATRNESNGPESNGPWAGVTLMKFVCGLHPMRTRWIRHFRVSRAVIKGTRACLSLQAIKGTRPGQMRQHFRSRVLPVIDYAALAWYGPGKHGVVRLARALEKIQRLGVRMILRAWKAVSLHILEAEAYLEPTRERLERKVIAHTVKLISLPTSNPARKALPHALNVDRYISPLSAVCMAAKARLKPRGSGPPMENLP